MNTTTTETKTNRYTLLGTELKRLSAELKAKKQEMIAAIRKLEDEYRTYRKDVYAPARKDAWQKFKDAKVRAAKSKAEAKASAEKVKVEKKAKVQKAKVAKAKIPNKVAVDLEAMIDVTATA